MLNGDVDVGEMVWGQGGVGALKTINLKDDSITITLHPWECDITYQPSSRARMQWYEPNLIEWKKKRRSDILPAHFIHTIEAFHLKHNHPSPNAKDQLCRRHPDYPRQKMCAPAIYRHETWDQLWVEFQQEHPAKAMQIKNNNQPIECPMLLRTHAPWNMIKGKDSSCLCINCEGTNAVRRGSKAIMRMIKPIVISDEPDNGDEIGEESVCFNVEGQPEHFTVGGRLESTQVPTQVPIQELTQRNQHNADNKCATDKLLRIYIILNTPSKYDMCVSCLPCLTSGKLEGAKFKCINGNCEICGFDKLWKHGVRARIFKREFDATKGEWIDKLNPNSKLATDTWLERVEWRDYEYKTKPTLATHAKEIARQASLYQPPDVDDLDYNPTENASAQNLVLETKRGTLVDYLDHFERKMAVHIDHRNLISSEHQSKLQYTQNSRPLLLARDIDFAENGSIENFDKVQSEHLILKQYTLFMSITSFFQVVGWNDKENKLDVGAEVTVNGEHYVGELKEKTLINLDSHWAKVIGHIGGSKDVYQVEDEGGRLH